MSAFLKRKAAKRLLCDSAGALRGRLTVSEVLNLWFAPDGTTQRNLMRQGLARELRAAIAAGELTVEVDERETVVHAPAAGWTIPFGASFNSDLDELHARTAPRKQKMRSEWITRTALRTWLTGAGGWPPEEDSPLRHWWPDEKWLKGSKAVLGEVQALRDQGSSIGKAVKAVAAKHGLKAESVNKARKRLGNTAAGSKH